MEWMCSEPPGRIWDWLVGSREIRESLEKNMENPENWEVPDGVPQGSRCDRTGRDRSVSEASDETDVLGAFGRILGLSILGGSEGELVFRFLFFERG